VGHLAEASLDWGEFGVSADQEGEEQQRYGGRDFRRFKTGR
jgi:hypothetical protein